YETLLSRRGSESLTERRRIAREIGLIHEVVRTTQCERLILSSLNGRSAPLFDKFPSRRPHNIKRLWFSKALLRMMINPCGEHTPQYLGLFQLLTFAFRNETGLLGARLKSKGERLHSLVDRQKSICGDSHFRLSRPTLSHQGST